MNLFDSIKEQNSIIKNEDVFNPDFMPEELFFREKEIKEIAISLKGAAKRKGENLLLYGSTGCGKTTCAKYVLSELEDYSRKIKGIYINCWVFSTRFSVLNQIAYSLDEFVPRRGLAPDQLVEIISNSSIKEDKIPVVILDEVDSLVKRKEDSVLYDLLRIEEMNGGKINCISITNETDFSSKLERRIKSSFAQKSIQFVPYRPDELRGIIRQRALLGLYPQTFDDDIIGACAGFSARNMGDARLGIRLLFMASKEAEKKDAQKINLTDVENSKKQIFSEIESEKTSTLGKNEKKILKRLLKNEWTTTATLYEELDIDKREIRTILEKLEMMGFASSIIGEGGAKKVKRV
ncbi:MAG: AAA family ATPase [Candidatus Micrarchaeia archaeon]